MQYLSLMAAFSVSPTPRLEMNFQANSLSPLKWTKSIFSQSSLEDFSYEP